MRIRFHCRVAFTAFTLVPSLTAFAQGAPKVIAWQAPSGPSYSGNTSGCLPSYNADYFFGPVGHTNLGFLLGVLPNISGIGVTVPWNCIDNCTVALDAPCATPASPCAAHMSDGHWEDCFNWGYLDSDLLDYVSSTNPPLIPPFTSKKIVLIIRPESDSGGVNHVTPAYVFHSAYAATKGWNPQDLTVCPEWEGTNLSSSPVYGFPPSNPSSKDYGIWNQDRCTILPGSPDLHCSCGGPGCNFSDISGFPVVYEKPIMNSYQNFLMALFKHYSSQGSPAVQQIAPYILYSRIGLSHGGENYPICGTRGQLPSCNNPPCGTGDNNNSTWPGPQGQFVPLSGGEQWLTPLAYSDAGYLTQWPTFSDGAGYTTAMMQFLNTNATFPVTIASSYGPPGKSTQFYADLEAEFAAQNNVGFGNQVLNIYDTIRAGAGTPSVDNWVANFRNYPYAPVHHLQTQSPGNSGSFAAGFTIDHITVASGPPVTATVTCAGSASCGFFCPGDVYIVGNSNPALNGVFPTANAGTCGTASVVYTPIQPVSPGPYMSGTMWGSNYWPITMPFATQQGVTAIEVWECDVDFAFGTETSSTVCPLGLSGPNTDYQNAVANTLLGLPAGTSFHTESFYNGWQY